MTWQMFALLTAGLWLTVVTTARIIRNRFYAMFVGVMLGIYSLIALSVIQGVGPLRIPFMVLHCTVFVNFLFLAWPRLRPLWFRALVSIPSAFMVAGTLLALPWALVGIFTKPPFLFIPYMLAAFGLFQSLTSRKDEVDVVVGDGEIEVLRPHRASSFREERPLRIVQITDPHLGPFMSVRRLRAICARAVERDPDLIFLTGDFLTMESQRDVRHLSESLAPLRAMPGKVFACLGNHDHEALDLVKRALTDNGVALLVDESTTVETAAGKVQIVGFDYHFRERSQRIHAVANANPRLPEHLRLILLHDPGAFRHLPEGDADLVLSGHTHGGQVGLVSFGGGWTFLRMFGLKIPDHGLWARGRDRLYVHRGTGHYGFPLRLGVPNEESLLRVHRVQ
jgi:uncharacterized protein